MTIGLTTEQLLAAFLNNLKARVNQMKGQLEAVKANENPQLAEIIKQLSEEFPDLPAVQVAFVWLAASSLFDTIVTNNNALAKTVPHVDI